MSDHVQPWKWFAYILHVPASHRILPDLLGGDLQLTSHESRAARVKDMQDLTSVGKISEENRVPLTFNGKSWEEVPFRLKPGSKYKVAFDFLPNITQGGIISKQFLHSSQQWPGLFLRRAFPAPEWLCAGRQMKVRQIWEKKGCQLTTSTGQIL